MASSGFPSGQPAWQVNSLLQLASQNQLYGLDPRILSGVGQNESGWEVAGAGINSSGYGGFYGLGQNSTYSFGGQTYQVTPQELMDPSQGSFQLQSITAAAEIASLINSSGGSLEQALIKYTGGSPTDWNDVAAIIGSNASATPTGGNPANAQAQANYAGNPSGTTPSTTAPPVAQLTGVAGMLQAFDAFLNPHKAGSSVPIIGSFLNIGTDIETTIMTVVGRGLVFLVFAAIGIGGIYMLVRRPVTAAKGLIAPIQAQQRIGAEQARIGIAQQAEYRRGVEAGIY